MNRLDRDRLAEEHLEIPCRAVQSVSLGHLGKHTEVGRVRSAAAGAVAASAWALQEPIDQRVFRYPYSDVALLGKFAIRGPGWWRTASRSMSETASPSGSPSRSCRRRVDVDSRRLAMGMALAEHVALFSLGALVDRYHPARGEPGVPPIFTKRAFAQATWRHALFGWLLGRLA